MSRTRSCGDGNGCRGLDRASRPRQQRSFMQSIEHEELRDRVRPGKLEVLEDLDHGRHAALGEDHPCSRYLPGEAHQHAAGKRTGRRTCPARAERRPGTSCVGPHEGRDDRPESVAVREAAPVDQA